MKKLLLFLSFALLISNTNFAQVPTNDLFQNATLVDKSPFNDLNLRLDLASVSNGGQTGCNLSGLKVVHYKFTAEETGLLTIAITDASNAPISSPVAIVFTAPNLNIMNENELAVHSLCAFGETTNVTVTQGISYYILVSRAGSSFSNIKITIPLEVPISERNALVDFYNATNGVSWTNNTNWNTTNPASTWFGLTVEKISGINHITGISFNDNNVAPAIPASIDNLTELKEFFVNNTATQFTPRGSIPPQIGNLSNLTSFWIENWNLQGSLPTEIGNLNVGTLVIRSTSISGAVPSSLTSMSSLTSLSINNNNFSGTIPDFTTSSLNFFRIQSNNFQFGDFENEFATYQTFPAFTYSPQKANNVSPSNFIVNVGDNVTLNSAPISGSANQYQWYLNVVAVTGGTSPNLDLSNIQSNQFGTYQCVVTSTLVPSLSILAGTFEVGLDPTTSPDYNALVAFYNATNGADWSSNFNWLDTSQPLTTWFGLTVVNNRVTDINLNQNNLIGTLPTDLGNLTNLVSLSLRGNQLLGNIPNELTSLTNLENLALQQNNLEGNVPDFTTSASIMFFQIDDNKFQFGDFENEFVSYETNLGADFGYNPQQKTSDNQTQTLNIGDNKVLNANVSGSNNLYQWYLNNTLIVGEVSSTLTLNNIQLSQFGTYRCDVTNTVVTGLTLQTGDFVLVQNPLTHPDYNALVAFYNATKGNNWTNNTNWLDANQPIASWFGITETNGRVTDINLNQNNLNGVLPPEIGDLTALKTFNVRLNSIWGKLPSTFFNLTNLVFLDLNSNSIGLLEALPPEIGNFTNLTWLDLGWNLFTGNIPIEISNLTSIERIYLHNNRFNGTIPSSITSSTTLQVLFLANNNLSGIVPDVTAIPTLFFFNMSNNMFLFADLETNFNALSTLGGNFIYSPQNKIGNIDAFAVDIGNSINLNVVSGLGNSLSIDWYKDEAGVLTFISSGLTLNVSINSASDYGDYKYLATSSIVTGLTLESNLITLGSNPITHPDYNALLAIYNALDGPNWINPWDITAPIHTWDTDGASGAVVFDALTDRVTRLSLGSRNLSGTIPPEIGNLTELTGLWLQNNDISGEIPVEIWNLTKMVNMIIGLQSSRQLLLSGGIPPEISNMTNLFWLNLSWVPLTLPLQPELFNIPSLARLRMAECGLTGTLPAGFATIDNVILDGNNFEGIIPTEILNSSGNSSLTITNNFFDFSDLEPLVLANNYTILGYTPQRTKDVAQTVNETPGNDIVLSVDDTNIAKVTKAKAANNEYQWFKDNVAITGANASTYTIFNAQPTDSGVYFCEITNPLLPGLIITRADITVNVGTFSIEDNELNTLIIYPNPARNILNIKLSNYLNTISTNIYDITGKLILSKNLNSAESQIDVSSLQTGLYFIRIEVEKASITKRFIKQ